MSRRRRVEFEVHSCDGCPFVSCVADGLPRDCMLADVRGGGLVIPPPQRGAPSRIPSECPLRDGQVATVTLAKGVAP